MEGLSDLQEVRLLTPFGEPSDAYLTGSLDGRPVSFLSRHGRGHRKLPSEINYRANVYGFKLLGVERIFSASAVGSLREEIEPLHIVLPDQLVDRTRQRASTFFGEGVAAHVSLADPFCPELRGLLSGLGARSGVTVHAGGTYLCIEGPQFSTRAESSLYRSWGADVIGMTNATEARLAREAEICYASVAMVTDYDCWRQDEEAVTAETLLAVLRANAAQGAAIIGRLVAALPEGRTCSCGTALASALVTEPAAVTDAARRRLDLLVGRYLPGR